MHNENYTKQIIRTFSKSPWTTVILIAVVAVLWVGSGVVIPSEDAESTSHVQGKLNNLQMQKFTAIERNSYIQQNGITEPKTFAIIKAEVEGRVMELLAKDGAFLKKGEPILRLDERGHKTDLEKAKATLLQKKISYKSAEAIFNKGLSSTNAFADADAQLKAAESQMLQSSIALQNTVIRAPFDGNLDHITTHVGDLLHSGDSITTFVAHNPMLVVAYISERDVGRIDKNKPAIVKLQGRPDLNAMITFISGVGHKSTRSFRLEAAISNDDNRVLSGETVAIQVPAGVEKLHKLPAMALSINLVGVLTVKTVTDEHIVKSYPIEIVEEEQDGVWVKGLPEVANIILMGQSFVSDGDKA